MANVRHLEFVGRILGQLTTKIRCNINATPRIHIFALKHMTKSCCAARYLQRRAYYYDLLLHKAAKITQIHAINTLLAYIMANE